MNRVVLWLLARPRLGRRANTLLVGLRVRGRRTGRICTFPVEYAVERDGLIVMPAHHESKNWWRNLIRRTDIEVLWMAEWVKATGYVTWAWDPEYVETRAVYLAKWPHALPDVDQPFVRIAFAD